ncbi:hypothetical protein DL93DRAFT_2081802 [Clavulina sp. PMI_390]|nr:hypothetical protein DL93DRAFT_2081802 [Clavulina sp. PMI_390]
MAKGVWCKSAFVTTCFGTSLGAVSNATLLTLLHVHPSALTFPTWRERQATRGHRAGARSAGVVVAQDITVASCHDGPLETELMERLEKHFPQGEESRSYESETSITAIESAVNRLGLTT